MNEFAQLILLSDIGEILGAIVGLVALIAWVIQQIAGAGKEMGGKRPAPADGLPQAQAAGAPRPAGQQADPLRSQVEEFLRRAGQGQQPNQGGQQPRRVPPPAQEIEVLLDDDALAERRPARVPLRMEGRPAAASRKGPAPVAPSDQRPARRSVIPRKRKTLAERADERAAARTETLAKQVSHLGQRVIEEDQQFDVQLKAKFDHTVGTLAGQSVASSELVPVESSSPAGQIAAMLASPDGVRQAIVINEILRRPVDRW